MAIETFQNQFFFLAFGEALPVRKWLEESTRMKKN
jgi:hypothetical protein